MESLDCQTAVAATDLFSCLNVPKIVKAGELIMHVACHWRLVAGAGWAAEDAASFAARCALVPKALR